MEAIAQHSNCGFGQDTDEADDITTPPLLEPSLATKLSDVLFHSDDDSDDSSLESKELMRAGIKLIKNAIKVMQDYPNATSFSWERVEKIPF